MELEWLWLFVFVPGTFVIWSLVIKSWKELF